jgi:hypothetical protein
MRRFWRALIGSKGYWRRANEKAVAQPAYLGSSDKGADAEERVGSIPPRAVLA